MEFENENIDYNAQSAGVLPMSYEAEQSVLGAILLEPDCLATVAEILPKVEFFHGKNNQIIYAAMLEMFTLGRPVDFITILDYLQATGEFNEESSKVYLTQLAQIVPAISNIEHYARIVKDKYDLRNLILAARGILSDVNEGVGTTTNLLDSAEQRIYDIRQGKSTQGLTRINQVLLETYEKLDILNSPEADLYRGIGTGIGELDKTITGLNRSDLIILAARPGMGKTSFALNIARHASVNEGRTVAFFSLEMSKEQLGARMLSTESMVESSKMRTGKLDDSEWTRLIEGGDILGKANLYFDDTPGITTPEMKAKLRRLKGVDLVVIDYLQLMSSAKKIDNRVQEISEITRNLKILAKELSVPVIALSQLARSSEKRNDHKPVLSDLRDSGSIEQDADIVLFLYREAYYGSDKPVDGDDNQNKSECIVAKNRHGESRSVPLHWQGEFTRFTSQEYTRDE
ncbi:MAG: replicative DNA helicase [Clostridia bacterium]